MLWDVDPSAWLFQAVITVFNLILDFMVLVGGRPHAQNYGKS